eukprot:15367066-Ditylum_brightwellii.AAC.2
MMFKFNGIGIMIGHSASRAYEDVMNIPASNYVMRSTLLPSGKSSTDGDSDMGRLYILLGQGGGGKSYATDDILTTLTSEYKFTADNYRSTLHSHKEDFGLSVGKTSYLPLSGKFLEDQQEKCNDLKLFIMNEFSMLRQKEIYYFDERLKQIMCSSIHVGGVTILLVGDPAQLLLLHGQTLWNQNSSNVEDARRYNRLRD